MNVFVDHHHAALYHSFQLLFERRLGWKVYRQIGPEWYNAGYWKIYDHPHTVNQFLGLHQASETPKDVHGNSLTENERKNLRYIVEDGIYYIADPVHRMMHRAVTLEKFKSMKFDIIISSIPQHIAPFNELISKYQPNAKHIFQVGNCWGHQPGVKNILASTSPFVVPADTNICFYHQEFDLDIFRYEDPTFHNVVHSYIHYMQKPELMDKYKARLLGWQFTKFGAGMDLPILEARGVADAIRRSAFTWHYKPEGDGYGHSIFSSYACGRPALIWGSQYKGKLAESLFVDGITCIDMEKGSLESNVNRLKYLSHPDRHLDMCVNASERFKKIVDFDAEFEKIKRFLSNLR